MTTQRSFRGLVAVASLMTCFAALLCAAAEKPLLPSRPLPTTQPAPIIIGFVGGFVRHTNAHHGPVLAADQFRQSLPGAHVEVFENRRRKNALRQVVSWLDTNRDGTLSEDEKSRARIVIYGQSWGASAAVLLARDLGRAGIPVLLTAQVDSVAKVWQNDTVIPGNVAAAVNFYQTDGVVHGRREIKAANPVKTTILGNYRMDYGQNPVQCSGFAWWDRKLTPGHMQSECDLKLWSQIENLALDKLQQTSTSASYAAVNNPRPTH